MGSRERRDRARKQVRAKILDAARELFVTEGYEAVSMRKIADAIEYSPTAIYVHFKDKAALLHELCAHDFEVLAENFRELAKIPDPIERLRSLGLTFIRFCIRHPNQFRLMFMTPHRDRRNLPAQTLERRGDPDRDGYAQLRRCVIEAMHQKRFRDELSDVELVTQTFAAAVHGVVALHVGMGEDGWVEWKPVEERARAAVDAIIRGLTKPDSAPSTTSQRKLRIPRSIPQRRKGKI